MKRFVLWIAGVCLVIMGSVDDAAAQRFRWPENPENLKVLEVSGNRLRGVMRGMTDALGVRCGHCHVNTGDGGGGLSDYDFASDEKELKLKARGMLTMVSHINTELIPGIVADHKSGPQVQCITCHRGQAKP